MQVQGATQTWTFQYPLTLEVEVERGAWQSISTGEFRIYNLAPSTRSDIYQNWLDQGEFRSITLRAGYLSWITVNGPPNFQSLPLIFKGNIKQAYSKREGSSWVTTISAWDGGFAVTQGDTYVPFPADAKLEDIVNGLIDKMPNVTLGYLDPLLTSDNIRGVSPVGSPWDKLTQIAAQIYADVYIDVEKVYFVAKGQPVPGLTGGLGVISSEQGLLDTPMKQGITVSFEMLFEPRVTVGQALVLQSLEKVNNGTYTVVGIDHRGTISGAVGGDMRTKLTCSQPQGYQASGAIQ